MSNLQYKVMGEATAAAAADNCASDVSRRLMRDRL